MFFFFVCGQTNFSKPLKGYENIRTLCFNCRNWNATVIKQRPTFTVCYIPILPHTIHGYKDVYCNTCHYTQPLETRPELIAQAEGHAPPHQGGPPQGGQGSPPPQGYSQQGPPPPQGQQGYPQPPPGYAQYNQNQQKPN